MDVIETGAALPSVLVALAPALKTTLRLFCKDPHQPTMSTKGLLRESPLKRRLLEDGS